ncbi:MAG: NAD(P)H-quinone oxidoreductase [Rickettsiales bacterium]|nr:NAD(P)H-quinone oxidoreductase [Rickettsiales bacterium]
MRAITIHDQTLLLDERPEPICQAGQVKIRVAYAGLNRADVMQKQGTYPAPPDAPADIPGLEISGTITDVSDDIVGWNIGDEVCALLPGGGYAEEVCVDAQLCLPIPKGLSLKQAAVLPECVTTIWMTLWDAAHIQPNQSVLIHGGSSGIGTTGIQMLKSLGATIFTTAGTDEKCQLCESLGATAINYKTEDFVEIVKAAGGVDIVLDMVGGSYIARNLKCLKPQGQLISIACLEGADVHIGMGGLLMKGLSWQGCTLRSKPNTLKGKWLKQIAETVWPWLEAGNMTPVMDEIFDLHDAAAAQEKMEKGLHLGKILLKVGG